MKGKSLLILTGGMLALGWSGSALASQVTTQVDFTNIHFNTTGTVTVEFLAVAPGSTAKIEASSFAGQYDNMNNQITDLGSDSSLSYTGIGGSQVPGLTGTVAMWESLSKTSQIHAAAASPTPAYQNDFAYSYAFSMNNIWQTVRIKGGSMGGSVSVSGDYTFQLNDYITDPAAHDMGDEGTGYVGLDIVLNSGMQTDRFKTFKYSIDEAGQYNTSGTISTDTWTVVAGSNKSYTFNAEASAAAADPHATPEPATMLLLGSGLAGLLGLRRKKD